MTKETVGFPGFPIVIHKGLSAGAFMTEFAGPYAGWLFQHLYHFIFGDLRGIVGRKGRPNGEEQLPFSFVAHLHSVIAAVEADRQQYIRGGLVRAVPLLRYKTTPHRLLRPRNRTDSERRDRDGSSKNHFYRIFLHRMPFGSSVMPSTRRTEGDANTPPSLCTPWIFTST